MKVVGEYRGESRAVRRDDGRNALIVGGEECCGWRVIRCLQRIEHECQREQQGGNEGGCGSHGVGDLGRVLDCRGAQRLGSSLFSAGERKTYLWEVKKTR